MPSYFRQVPNFEYVSVLPDAKIGDYLPLKNLFKKGRLREDIFQNLAFFEKYQIKGNDRPDNVAFEIYNDSTLDWVVLLSNNIVNVQTEWPLTQDNFDRFLIDKYGDYDTIYNGIHHYVTEEAKNSQGVVIVPAGLRVNEIYFVSYYDYFIDQEITTPNLSIPVTNYEYEEELENNKRNIYVLKPSYLNVVLNDMKEIMPYKEGSSQYKTETLKTADNIRLYS
jgi:hypothetical protein